MYGDAKGRIAATLEEIREAGLYKDERIITSPQNAEIRVTGGHEVINFCANNYLGLSNDPRLLQACHDALERYGYGLSSVRFICGTQTVHKELEGALSAFLRTDDTILYSSCFDANGGLFETLLGPEDAVISDSLNHASIIDGIRLCKARRIRWSHGDLAELEQHLQDTQDCRTRLIATDGVFSMDGDIADLKGICDLAERYGAMVMVDDSHSTGFFGPTGRGTAEHCDVMGKIDIITSTLGKALGGASGGFTSGRQEIIDLLRQRSRPYLFSNSVPPPIAATALECVRMISETTELRDKLEANTLRFRGAMTAAGFDIRPGTHPIVPIMLGQARLAAQMADALLEEGIYVIGFSYPVVPKGAARIRVQISAAHTDEMIDAAVAAFVGVGQRLGVI
ncbi:MAG TPA: glycine C-acetyltransferase [Myxococcales bacterium]|nr:glycine C-acetyltransferase [Myxococcales bacterium]HAN30591.1 glycine C-acetyltransferase [Myxococcales bacterium]